MITRTEHAIKNTIYTIVVQVVNIIIKFIVRTVFIYTLGREYLGIGGVFSNILTVLSLAEMGIGTAIVYDMYKPIAEKNETKISQLYVFYKRVYTFIGLVITFLGLLLLPFLNYILTDVPNVKYIELIYCLHLADSVSTYFFAHCRSLLSAHQLERVNSKNSLMVAVLKTLLEIVVLITTHSYVLYMLAQIIVRVYGNYIIYLKVNKYFPYLNRKTKALELKDRKRIFSNSLHMLTIRISSTMINATDNIIISALISTVLVGIYSNYNMIIQIIWTTTFLLETSLVASVGNLCATESVEKKYEIYLRIRFIYTVMYCFISVALFTLLNPFIELWLGESFLLSKWTVALIVVNCYLSGIRQPIEVFLNADGLFRYFTLKPVFEVVINIIISVYGAKAWGVNGVLLGTIISHTTTTLWYDAWIVYKHSLKKHIFEYFKVYGKGIGWTLMLVVLADAAQAKLNIVGIEGFLIRVAIALVMSCLIFLFYWKSYEFSWLKQFIKNKLSNKQINRE